MIYDFKRSGLLSRFRLRYFRYMLSRAHRLKSIGVNSAVSRKRMFAHLHRGARDQQFFSTVVLGLSIVILVVSFFGAFYYLFRSSDSFSVPMILGYTAGLWMGGHILDIVTERKGQSLRRLRFSLGTIAALCATGAIFLVHQPLSIRAEIQDGFLGFCLGASHLPGVFWLISYLMMLSFKIMQWHLARKYPESKLIEALLHSSWLLRDEEVWSRLETKRELMDVLENCARTFAYSVPRKIRGFDPASEAFIRNLSTQTAAALRSYKLWIFSPTLLTRSDLQAILVKMLIDITDGHWDYLPRAEPGRLSPSMIGDRLLRGLLAIGQSSVPVVLLFLWHLTPFGPPRPLFDKLAIVTFAVSAVYLLLSIDPGAETKIKGAGSVLGIFMKGRSGE